MGCRAARAAMPLFHAERKLSGKDVQHISSMDAEIPDCKA